MFRYVERLFSLCIIIKVALATGDGLSITYEDEKFLIRNITRIWRAVDPKETTIILHDVINTDTCYGICNEIGSRGPITTARFDGLRKCSEAPRDRNSTKMMVLFIYTGMECPTTEEARKIVNVMQEQCWWFHRVRLLYLLATTNRCNDVKFIYKQFWELGVLKISIVTYDVRDTRNLTIHQCDRFTNFCEQRHPNFAKPFNNGVVNMQGFELVQSTVLPQRQTSHNRDHLTAMYVVADEIDHKVMDLLAEKLNATQRIKTYLGLATNTSATVANDLVTRTTDIISNSVFIAHSSSGYDFVERTTFSIFTSACALVPIEYRAVAMNHWEIMFLSLGLALCVVGIVYIISLMFRFQSKPLQIFLILVGGSLSHLPTRWPPRIFLITWIYSSMFFSVVMQTRFTKSLIIKPGPKQIRTLSELDASGRILLNHPGMSYIIDSGSWENLAVQHVRDRSAPYRSNTDNCVEVIRGPSKDTVACLMETLTAEWFIRNTMRDNLPTYGITSECFLSQYKAFTVPRGSPYLPSINKLLFRIRDSGLFTKIIQNAMRDHSTTQSTGVIDNSTSSTTWERLRQGVYLTFFGYSISIVTFCLELIVHYGFNRKNCLHQKI